jgi:hypothetical protein
VRRALVLTIVGCGSGSTSTSHAPVDPALELAIAVPESMKRVEVDFVIITRSQVFGDGPTFAADEAAHNRSFAIGAPKSDGDGWVVKLTSRDSRIPDMQTWYRPLGGGLAITCTPIKAFEQVTAADLEVARATCFGVQRVSRGIYVPFRLSRTDKRTHLELALVGEPKNWSVELQRRGDAAKYTLDPKGVGGNQKLVDEGTLVDGSWWISSGLERGAGTRYDTTTSRTIGSLELVCHGDNYYDEAYTRRQLALCTGLEKP